MLDKHIPDGHLETTSAHWRDLNQVVQNGELSIDGYSLSLADVVAVAKSANTHSIVIYSHEWV